MSETNKMMEDARLIAAAAGLNAEVAGMQAEVAGMQAENALSLAHGYSPAYTQAAFEEALTRYNLKVPAP